MPSRVQARHTAVGAVRDPSHPYLLAAIALAALALAGCQPATVPVVAADPADPSVPVPGVHYRSSTAPYHSLRPVTPAPWRERNDAVAPDANNHRSGR
jgi:hypothetical protein